jgi:hypothetical protein
MLLHCSGHVRIGQGLEVVDNTALFCPAAGRAAREARWTPGVTRRSGGQASAALPGFGVGAASRARAGRSSTGPAWCGVAPAGPRMGLRQAGFGVRGRRGARAGRPADRWSARATEPSAVLILAHPTRVLFGTDASPPTDDAFARHFRFFETDDECFTYTSSNPPSSGRWTISGIDLPPDALANVYALNAQRIVPALRTI